MQNFSLAYAQKVTGIREILAGVTDTRKRPLIPTVRIVQNYPRAFDVVAGDALYAQRSWSWTPAATCGIAGLTGEGWQLL